MDQRQTALLLNSPRPYLDNRLLEEANCAQLMHNKQMELDASLQGGVCNPFSQPLSLIRAVAAVLLHRTRNMFIVWLRVSDLPEGGGRNELMSFCSATSEALMGTVAVTTR
ncbi:Hypothetical protein SMAX5B_000573 [Scophthalmus maximus]|uniref:Uncharacterized protein n=1 Tax=Scophthalmus maximus TaxID=52904 RepID=A0A2U9CSH2_SCOMX|nr:Hypothetical protein SMAX5B_000573 [Scophthalmus maximus]